VDKHLVGKWYKEDLCETLNIFDEVPLRIKMSFSSSGYYNFEPNCVYEKDEYLCFEINDDYHRMVYHVKCIDGNLEGFYIQYCKETQIQYNKIDDIPEDIPFEYLPSEIYVSATETTRIDILKQYAEYDRDKEYGCSTEFVLGGNVPDLLVNYNYFEYINDFGNTNDELAFKLLDFVCDNFSHNGTNGLGAGRTITDLITFFESNDKKTNCRGLAILLASLLRLNGIKAQHITCMPYEDPFEDCHVVVDCLLPSGNRIMLDPTYRLYYKERNGKFVSLTHLRDLLLAEEPIYENPTAGYNGNGFNKEYNRNYMIKNTFRFARCTLSKDGVDGRTENSRYIELIPKNYSTDHFPKNRKENFVYNDIEFWQF